MSDASSRTLNAPLSTYERASEQIKEYVQSLWPGALAVPFSLRDQDGRPLGLHDDHLAGRPLLVLLVNQPNALGRVLADFAAHQSTLQKWSVPVVVISASIDAAADRLTREQSGSAWPVLCDSTGAVFAGYGLHKDAGDSVSRAVLLTPGRQVRAWFDWVPGEPSTIGNIMSEIEQSVSTLESHWTTTHAPVLQVPGVLTREECAEVIRAFEHDEPLMIRPPRSGEIAGNYKIPVYEHNRQDRIDQIIKEPQALAFLDQRIWDRVVPVIKKAFAYEVTRREDLHVARYVGKRGGHAMGHRDNVSQATAYRRFALSLNLNDDYEGGEVAFSEYGNQRYKSVAGTALVFSSALLHEVLETTSGTRYTLISHFFNEQSLPNRSA